MPSLLMLIRKLLIHSLQNTPNSENGGGAVKNSGGRQCLYSLSLIEKLSFMTILCHFGRISPNTLPQLGCIIPNIHVTLDHFPVILDIFCHFGQCHKRSCFLQVCAFKPVRVEESKSSLFSTYIRHCMGLIRLMCAGLMLFWHPATRKSVWQGFRHSVLHAMGARQWYAVEGHGRVFPTN